MRILVSTDVVGGVWRYTVTLVREMADRGHRCAVAILGRADADRVAELPPGVEVFEKEFRLEWMPGGLEDVPAATAWLGDTARRWRADVVHLNQFAYAVGDFGAPVVVVAHSDMRSWFIDVKGMEAPAAWAPYTDMVRTGLAAAAVVVAPTAYQSGRLAQHYGRTAARVIHNGIRAPAETADLPGAAERSLILVAGRAWDAAKGVDLLEEALEELGDEGPTVHLVGPLEGPAGEVMEARRLVAHGEVPGEAMARFYRNTRLYVGPSFYEPFGLTPLEAAAYGCGLLLSGIGSFRELWQDAASFFRPGHAGDLALRLRNLLEEPDTIERQASVAQSRARSLYTAERMAGEYEAIYRRVAGDAAASATSGNSATSATSTAPAASPGSTGAASPGARRAGEG